MFWGGAEGALKQEQEVWAACAVRPRPASYLYSRMNRGGPRGGFIPAETLVINGTAGDNGAPPASYIYYA